MLLPQSSAFAALKNRLNSVSAIGYLHIAPRTYVPPSVSSFYHSRQKSSETAPSSSQPASSVSSFERPNRLKAREEGGIRWVELLEKFKNVQEKARRSQRLASLGYDVAITPIHEKEKAQPPEVPPKHTRPNSAASTARPTPVVQQGHQKSKSSLSNLGRFAGGVSARKTKR